MGISLVTLGTLLALTGAQPGAAGTQAGSHTVSHCLVTLIQEAQVPAEEAGVLIEVVGKEGQQVRPGDPLARIDDSRALMQHRVSKLELKVAQEQAANDINVRYAQAAAEVAEAEYQQAIEANRKVSGSVPMAEVRRLLLTHNRSVLQIEQAKLDLRVSVLESQVREAEVEAAMENVDRRHITAPLNGEVVKVYRHAGEWVQPGDPVIHVVRMDRLRVEGFLNAKDYSQAEIAGRSITATVNLARGRRESFQGKVVFVSPLVEAGGEFRIWAEVLNRQQNDNWLLSPGMAAELTIHLK